MKVYQTSAEGYLIGTVTADESPLEPGVMLIPFGCVTTKPPKFDAAKKRARYTGNKWALEDLPKEPETETGSAVDQAAAPAPVMSKLLKYTFWSRCSENEAVAIEEGLTAASARLRRIFEAMPYFDTQAPDYPAIKQLIVEAVGDERAEALLEPEGY